MSYLFFDIESANRHNRTAKVYSFGYVITDNKFNILKQEEIIINPEADYYFRINGEHVKIDCPIDSERMSKAGIFPDYHSEIGKLLCSNTCIGYGTAIDAHMLHESCKRYDLESFEFRFYDLTEISDVLLKKKVPGLNALAEHLGIINENPHNGLSDAITTYEVCMILLDKYKRNLDTMRYKNQISIFEAKGFKVFKIVKGKYIHIPKRRFKDMEIKEKDIVLERTKLPNEREVQHNNQLGEELKKWLKEGGFQDTHTHNNN